ncbi:Crp/Fnr family transcriptional regulator [Oleiagrimonas sp.]|uniref:Crp/Fnr family transcriptional regulator n=1 Tax=Oleiagrimonas sp. TaxID=2010330 RepID=UPI0026301587|nr:Crp/Fnr family transcriptional regulator [Oleiagrimonas sp.]
MRLLEHAAMKKKPVLPTCELDRQPLHDRTIADVSMNTSPHDLQGHYLFDGLDDEQRRRLLEHSRTRKLAAGEAFFMQGDRADQFWWLESGQIKLYRLSRDGHQKVMGLVMPKQSFAEGILFMEPPRYPVNAEAVVESTILGVDRRVYLDILKTSFVTCRKLFQQMVLRTQRHLDEIESLTIQNTRYRLVHYLLHQITPGANVHVIKLPARKAVIASQLAMQPETLSRLFRELENSGLIRVRGDVIHVLDSAKLQQQLT